MPLSPDVSALSAHLPLVADTFGKAFPGLERRQDRLKDDVLSATPLYPIATMNVQPSWKKTFLERAALLIAEGDEEVLDQIVDLDPETAIGRVLTDFMAQVTTHHLFDQFLGFNRGAGIVHIFFSEQAHESKLRAIVQDVEDENKWNEEEARTNISARYFKREGDPDSEEDSRKPIWIVELRYDEEGQADLAVDLEGDIDVEDSGEEEDQEPEPDFDQNESRDPLVGMSKGKRASSRN